MRRLLSAMILLGCVASAVEPAAAASTNAQPNVSEYEFWHVHHLHDAFFDGQTTYLDVSDGREFATWWDPRTARKFSPSPEQIRSARRLILYQDEPMKLPGGSYVRLHIDASGARCGYTVGVRLDYNSSEQAAKSFYVIERLSRPQVTHYCGQAVLQRYDAVLVSAYGLSDGRLMVVDYLHGLVVVLRAAPDEIVKLGASTLLVPGRQLTPALDAADDNRARYAALLKVMRTEPAVSVVERNVD